VVVVIYIQIIINILISAKKNTKQFKRIIEKKAKNIIFIAQKYQKKRKEKLEF
jgi:hypothetical protein